MTAETGAPQVPSEVLDYLGSHSTMTIATASSGALPHAATMMYVNDGVTLYFCTRPDSTTAGHISQNPIVSFAIDEYSHDWAQTKGIQGTGEAEVLLQSRDISSAVDLFQRKFPSLSDVRTSNISFFRVTPTSVQFITTLQGGGPSGQKLATDYQRDMVYSVFRELPQHQVDTVAGSLDTVQVQPGDVVVRQGAPADKFFIIADGEVEVIREDDGQSTTVAHLKKGQFFGEMAVLREMPRTATVRAVKPSMLLSMDRDAFRSLVAQSLGTTEDFDQVIHQRLTELGQVKAGG